MKFCTFIREGQTCPGFELQGRWIVGLREAGLALVESGRVPKDARSIIELPDLKSWLSQGTEAFEIASLIHDLVSEKFPGVYPRNRTRLIAPLPDPGKIIAVGLNYRKHAEEQNTPLPTSPLIFAKFPSAVIGPDEPIKLPAISRQVDVEAELCAVVTRRSRNVTAQTAASSLAYCVGNDVSARDLQYSDRQWVRGKSCDTFAPLGPWIVTADEVGDPHSLAIELKVDDEIRQSANTSDMIFTCFDLVEYLSRCITLEPGDVIFTGTPSGVGVFREPPLFLEPGQLVTVTIEKLGTLTNPVVTDTISVPR